MFIDSGPGPLGPSRKDVYECGRDGVLISISVGGATVGSSPPRMLVASVAAARFTLFRRRPGPSCHGTRCCRPARFRSGGTMGPGLRRGGDERICCRAPCLAARPSRPLPPARRNAEIDKITAHIAGMIEQLRDLLRPPMPAAAERLIDRDPSTHGVPAGAPHLTDRATTMQSTPCGATEQGVDTRNESAQDD